MTWQSRVSRVPIWKGPRYPCTILPLEPEFGIALMSGFEGRTEIEEKIE